MPVNLNVSDWNMAVAMASSPQANDSHSVRRGGFTLIELLVALAIMAIVSAVAVPIYTSYSKSTYRGEAMSDLLLCSQALERFASENFTYVGADDGSGGIDPAVCTPLSGNRYTITLAATVDTFTLTATPTAGPMATDGALDFNSSGVRRWKKDNGAWLVGWDHD